MQVPRTLPEGGPMLPQVRNAVAISSAKGGVGKSTLSVNLALSLVQAGFRVGLLDADIYGPSIPLMMGLRRQPQMEADGRMRPLVGHGVGLASIGFIAGEDAPVIWRGPLLGQALQHFLEQVAWGELDFLLIDMPPGTGDIALSLSQSVALSGAVVVTTPQDVALEDVERGIAMFEKVEVEVLGLVENMSFYQCPECGERCEIFGCGGGREAARRLGLEFFGEIPLEPAIGQGGDCGRPLVAARPESASALLFGEIARKMVAALQHLAEE